MADQERETEPLLPVLQTDELPPVYNIIHQIRQDVIKYIDTPLSYADLTSAELTYAFVKPLEEKYTRMNNKSTVFCFLLNRVYFIRDQNFSTASLNKSRATLCEILATRTIRQWDNLIELSNILITSWPVFSGCSNEVLAKGRELKDEFDELERVGNAMEMAVISDAKIFVKSAPCQKVISAIWSGTIVYTAESAHSLIRDSYKRTPIHYYDPRKAPLLDHYRLKVPAVRSVLEYGNFLVLFILFVIALEFYELEYINLPEALFMLYASGFCLEKLAAMQEHGLRVYIHGTWNGFDVAFIMIYVPYLLLRLYGMYKDERSARVAGMDCLALAACLLFPRLAFVTLSNNLMVLAFRAMFAEFATLMGIAAFCFTGFLYCLWTLSRGTFNYTPGRITWWMLDLYFGLDATGFERATTFHPTLGPFLMVTFACLSNTLLLTVLVSILSHTFSTISSDAEAEAKFRRAVATLEGVKADALFSYLPPMNLLAFGIMYPASFFLTPRWFHKVNVFMIRVCAAPVLLLIGVYERNTFQYPGATFYDRVSHAAERAFDSLPRRLRRLTFFEGLAGNGADIDAFFQIEDEISQSAVDMDDGSEFNPQQHDGSTRPSGERRRPSAGHLSPDASGQAIHIKRTASMSSRTRSGALVVDAQTPVIQPSPLAQLYQPLFFEDEGNGGDENQAANASSSFVQRRRQTPMNRQRRPSVEPFQSPAQSHPASHPARPGGLPPAEHMSMPNLPTTVPEDLPLFTSSDGVSVTKRLLVIEERQQRIENLLVALAGELRMSGNRPDKANA